MACPEDINALILSQVELGPTTGVGYLGVAISSMIYGVTCIQTFHYFRSPRCGNDTTYLKSVVVALWLLDTAHQAIIISSLYHYLILNYANPVALLKAHWCVWSIGTEIIINAVIAFIVESFFVVRIWKLSRNANVSGVCMLFTVAHLTMNLVFPIKTFFYPGLVEAATKLKPIGSSGLGVAVLADVSISTAMVWYLRRGCSGIRKSNDMISRLIILTVTTGALTTLFVIADLIAYLAAPTQLYNLFLNFMLGKLYINALLTSLNGRTYVRGADYSVEIGTIPMSTLRAAPGTATEGTIDIPEPAKPSVSFDKIGCVA
ncbi:hypothetical protein BN946_scf184722.g6 [Trametes cinnabarina]|uniref:DUF6534 domain-containing protein n=1 Tax=Pycnoporus cinnabarinus TaxID=5643 RepID=A0A060T008_PYCCI|nr:hypothetical protein BN946_scf184722.g6 [Trametes cinnabarina]